jgi:uncharacterized repeat protein (TIGR03803 family)
MIVIPCASAAEFKVLHVFPISGGDGSNPYAGVLADGHGNLYGTTRSGGDNLGEGAIYKLALKTDAETLVYSFGAGNDGIGPTGGLIADKTGNFYGTTLYGGARHAGTVFEFARDGTETVLYSFAGGSDGAGPTAGLIADKAGNLYGTTAYGGGTSCTSQVYTGCGTVFKLSPDGVETVLHVFTGGTDGEIPYAGLLADKAGNLYGTTYRGGGGRGCADGCGTVYKLAPDGTETVLYAFQGNADGAQPYSGLIADAEGNLYGTTMSGGFGGPSCGVIECGAVFKLAPDGTETVLYAFLSAAQSNGASPLAGLVLDDAGNLYGTTATGGNFNYCEGHGCGTVYKIAPDGTVTLLHAFVGSDGEYPRAPLFLDKNGMLYGTTLSGTYIGGTLFSIKE